jgi:AraC-like DNA-binding protein
MTRSWTVPEIPNLECFRVVNFVHEYPRHSHATWAIGVVDDGTGGIWYRGANERGGPGELIAINPGEVHTGYPLQPGGISYSMLYVGEDLLKEILPGMRELPMFPGIAVQDSTLAPKLRRLCRSLEFGDSCLKTEAELLSQLRQLFIRHARAQVRQVSGQEPGQVRAIQEYLRANLHRNVSLNELVALTGLSKAYLIRSFRRTLGMPPYEWLLQLRIEEGRKRLREGSSISELAFELGFSDQSHFHRRFKRVTGMTPAAYAQGHYHSRQTIASLRGWETKRRTRAVDGRLQGLKMPTEASLPGSEKPRPSKG